MADTRNGTASRRAKGRETAVSVQTAHAIVLATGVVLAIAAAVRSTWSP